MGMGKKYSWLIAFVILALLVAACGPTMATPTPGEETPSGNTSSGTASVEKTPAASQEPAPTEAPTSGGDLPVDENDWHVLGSPDAPVTMVDYSDYQ
jgi:protein-disulfide isomerase